MADVLKIENLHVSFDTYAGEVHAVRGVSLHVGEGEVLAIVGESGCGKSVTAQTIMKLNPMPPARIKEGSIDLCGEDIVAANQKGTPAQKLGLSGCTLLFHGSSPEQSGTMAYRPVCKLCLVTIIPNTAPKSTGMREAEGEGPKRKFDKNRAASHTNVPRGTFTKRRPKKLFKKCALCYTKMAK